MFLTLVCLVLSSPSALSSAAPRPPSQTDPSQWLAANMVSSSFAIGVLGYSTFALGFVDAILVCFFFNLLGVLTVCWFSCFGPAFGLRQMVLSRFWFGYWPTKISKFL